MPEPLFQLRNITKQYGERRVLDVAALDIEEGEIVAIVGPSGAGKSTLLRLLNFLEEPSSGRIYFAGTWFDNAAAPPVPEPAPLAPAPWHRAGSYRPVRPA